MGQRAETPPIVHPAYLPEISETPGSFTATYNLLSGQVSLQVVGAPHPIILEGRSEYLLGREGDNQELPDVNLNLYRGREQGVSRLHALLRMERRRWWLMDLGSTNGTWLNGTPLTAHEPVRLENGDEIRLGKLAIKVNFNL